MSVNFLFCYNKCMNKKALGKGVKEERKKLRLTQAELAQGICSQALLSHIEAGDYMSAADIFIGIYQKLGISELQANLKNYFPMSQIEKLSQKSEELCRQHQYAELRDFLLLDSTIDAISEEGLQAYYYYLGVSQAQLGQLNEAQENLRLALVDQKKLTIISRLSWMSLGVISAVNHQEKQVEEYIEAAFQDLEKTSYDENLNVLYYLRAVIYKKLEKNKLALMTLEKGIQFISEHNSHYMLANFYYLAALLVENDKSRAYFSKSQLFTELYKEKVFDKI
ncbi:helix-turn-helix domain-containing protein [Lactococcus cremoris]|nr:helix-turn-helix domain-containing protein [Lactococcus cremoris]